MEEFKKKIINALIDQECFIFDKGDFESSAGFKVPFFIDVRRLFSDPKILNLVSIKFAKVCKESNIECIAGAETAGIPFATAISLKSGIPLVYIRKEAQDHGIKSTIAGKVPEKEKKIAIVDDSVGAGGSVSLFVENLRKEGFNPKLFLCVLDMNLFEGSEKKIWKKLKESGIEPTFLVTWQEWIEYMYKIGIMSERLKEVCLEAAINPLLFSDKEEFEKYYKQKKEGLIWFKPENRKIKLNNSFSLEKKKRKK